VRNEDGATSNSKTVTVTPEPVVPVISSINPFSVESGGPAFLFTVTGSSFEATNVMNVNGADLPTSFVSAQSLTAMVTPAADAGTMPVYVANSNGDKSNTVPLTVTSAALPAPVLSTIQPPSVFANDPAFQLTVTGSNFEAASVVRANNVDVPTVFVSSTSLTATITPPAAAGSMSVVVRNSDGKSSNGLVLTVAADTGGAVATCEIQGYFVDCVVIGGPYSVKVLGIGFSNSHRVQFDGVDQLTSYGITPGGQESLSVNALTASAVEGVTRVTVRESSGAVAQVGDLTTIDPAISDPPWVPAGATHYVDFVDPAQAKGWDGTVVCNNTTMSAMLGNDSNAAAYHTPNPTGYNSNNVTANGYDWNKGQNQVPAFEGTTKEALIYVGATVVLEYNSNATKNDIHFAMVASAASNHIAIKKSGLDVIVTSKNGPLNLVVPGALIEPTDANFVRNRIAFTKTIAPSLRFEIAVNGSAVVSAILDPADLTGLVAVCDQSKLIAGYEIYPALPDTAGLSELSALT
jgi:IPT/TIG domain